MKLKDRLLIAIAPPLAALIIRLLYWTIRTETIGGENVRPLWAKDEQVILSFWHDQLLLMVLGYCGPGAKILISASKDGELIARTMRYFGQDAVRGSSSRGGRAAFKALLKLTEEKVDLVFTPDGPKGPRHELKDGIVQLARMSKRSVVPMAFVCSRGHRFGSWDRFLLPYPFGRGVYSFGKPVIFDKEEGVEGFRDRLLQSIAENQMRAEARLEEFGVSAV
jgi:lysophospholipid acyltransferase (LPLAT)-like uncharacterized protein